MVPSGLASCNLSLIVVICFIFGERVVGVGVVALDCITASVIVESKEKLLLQIARIFVYFVRDFVYFCCTFFVTRGVTFLGVQLDRHNYFLLDAEE